MNNEQQNTLTILKDARKLITEPENWTTGHFARAGTGGDGVGSCDPRATCWCASGAIIRAAAGDREWSAVRNVLGDSLPGQTSVVGFNDRGNHPAVLALFDRAIAKLEARA